MVRLLVPFAVLLLAVLIATRSDRPLPRADFTFINKNDVTTLDPQRMSWMQDLRVARLLYEGLVRNDVFDWDYAIQPAAAERWEISPDRRTYTFHLRTDAKWSNGEAVTSHDFVYAWRRALLPDTAADYSGQFELIEGAGVFFRWRQQRLDEFTRAPADTTARRLERATALWEDTLAEFERSVAITAVDARTLVIRLVRPTPYFLDLCAFPAFFPVPQSLVSRFEHLNADTGMIESDHAWTKPPLLITNGPFELTRWRFKRDMRLERNPRYWNQDRLAIDSIDIPTIEDPNAAVMAFRTGAVDWVTDVVARYVPEMVAQKQQFYAEHAAEIARWRSEGIDPVEIDRRLPPDPRKNIHALPAFGTYFLNFNCSQKLPDGRDNPFRDPRVRRAFTMCTDRRTITQEVRRLGEPVSPTLIPPSALPGYRSPRGIRCISDARTPAERDQILAEARGLLAQAGYPDGNGFITVDVLFTKDGGHDLICQQLAKDWERYLGVRVTLTQKEIKVFREDAKKKNYIICRGAWYGDYGDPTTFLDINRTADGNNDRNYSNPEYDRLLDQALTQTDPQARLRTLEQAEELMLGDAPLLPLFTYAMIYCFDASRFTGISSHPRTDQALHLIDVFGDAKGADEPRYLPARPPHAPEGGAP